VDLDDDGLVLAAAELDDVADARPAVAVLALDHPDVGDLPAAGGVERRLGELDDHPPVVARDRAHGRVRLQRLIAHELRRRPLQPQPRTLHDLRSTGRPGALARGLALALVAVDVETQTGLLGELARQVEREPVGVLEAKDVLAAQALLPVLSRALDELLEQPRAALER